LLLCAKKLVGCIPATIGVLIATASLPLLIFSLPVWQCYHWHRISHSNNYDGSGPTLGLSRNAQQLTGNARFTDEEFKSWMIAIFWPALLLVGLYVAASFLVCLAIGGICAGTFVVTVIPASLVGLCVGHPYRLESDATFLIAGWPFVLGIGLPLLVLIPAGALVGGLPFLLLCGWRKSIRDMVEDDKAVLVSNAEQCVVLLNIVNSDRACVLAC
jgi:hypothetical protein